MTRRKKETPVEDSAQAEIEQEQAIEEQPTEQPTEEQATASVTCSNWYDFEVPGTQSLIVDGGNLALMLSGAFRPFQKYDQVNYQAQSGLHFGLFLAFRAVRPGGFFWVRPELAGMRMFRECPKVEMGGMVRITKE